MPVVPPPGGPARPSTAAGPPRRSPGVLLAIVIAGLSLVVALGSAVFAWRAIDQAQDARDIALAGRGGSVQPPAAGAESTRPPAAEQTPPPPADPVATEPPSLTVTTVYTEKYGKQSLTMHPGSCNEIYADLDEPRVNVGPEKVADIGLQAACGSAEPFLFLTDGVDGSTAATSGMTPNDCSDKIRTAPVAESRIPVRQGTVVCLTTSFSSARSRGDSWRLMLLEITGVGNDGAVTVQVSAWNIPG
jgi:hypothetical protein